MPMPFLRAVRESGLIRAVHEKAPMGFGEGIWDHSPKRSASHVETVSLAGTIPTSKLNALTELMEKNRPKGAVEIGVHTLPSPGAHKTVVFRFQGEKLDFGAMDKYWQTGKA